MTLRFNVGLTGSKVYGVHLGPVRTPFYEDGDPRPIGPGFYLGQEDELRRPAGAGGPEWTILRPDVVRGDAAGNAMDIAMVVGAYATLTKADGAAARPDRARLRGGLSLRRPVAGAIDPRLRPLSGLTQTGRCSMRAPLTAFLALAALGSASTFAMAADVRAIQDLRIDEGMSTDLNSSAWSHRPWCNVPGCVGRRDRSPDRRTVPRLDTGSLIRPAR